MSSGVEIRAHVDHYDEPYLSVTCDCGEELLDADGPATSWLALKAALSHHACPAESPAT